MHSGHLALLRTVARRARAQGGESVVLTFEPHPRVTLGRADGLRLLTSLEEKIYLLGQQGIDNLIVIPFDKTFSALAPDTFIRDYLVGRIGAETLVVGFNHRFGRDKAGQLRLSGQPRLPDWRSWKSANATWTPKRSAPPSSAAWWHRATWPVQPACCRIPTSSSGRRRPAASAPTTPSSSYRPQGRTKSASAAGRQG